MRHMSFSLTTEQMLDRIKTVTRRLGWSSLKVGTLLQAVEKSQGLRKGEKVRKLGVIRVVSVRIEPLHAIDDGDVWLEGFNMPAHEFVEMFCEANGCGRNRYVTRIEFEHVAQEAQPS